MLSFLYPSLRDLVTINTLEAEELGRFTSCQICWRSSGGVVVKLLVCGARGPGSIPGLVATISELGYLLLPSCDMTERSLMRRKSSKQPTNQIWLKFTKQFLREWICDMNTRFLLLDHKNLLKLINNPFWQKDLSKRNECFKREKGRDLTQSYGKSPYTQRKIQKQSLQTNKEPARFMPMPFRWTLLLLRNGSTCSRCVSIWRSVWLSGYLKVDNRCRQYAHFMDTNWG